MVAEVHSGKIPTIKTWLKKVGIDEHTSEEFGIALTKFVEEVSTTVEGLHIGVSGTCGRLGGRFIWLHVCHPTFDLEEPTEYPEMGPIQISSDKLAKQFSGRHPTVVLLWTPQEYYGGLETHIKETIRGEGLEKEEYLTVFE